MKRPGKRPSFRPEKDSPAERRAEAKMGKGKAPPPWLNKGKK